MASAIEYGLIAALVSVAGIAAMQAAAVPIRKATERECKVVQFFDNAMAFERQMDAENRSGEIRYDVTMANSFDHLVCYDANR